MNERQRLGLEAETEAADYLLSLGYSIITRRFRVRGGEIDLIALHGDVIVFVEVKSKYAPGYKPEEAIGKQKLDALRRAAREYLNRMGETRNFRFDVVAIDKDGLRHHEHIFNN